MPQESGQGQAVTSPRYPVPPGFVLVDTDPDVWDAFCDIINSGDYTVTETTPRPPPDERAAEFFLPDGTPMVWL